MFTEKLRDDERCKHRADKSPKSNLRVQQRPHTDVLIGKRAALVVDRKICLVPAGRHHLL
jgi:hypothetical protein